MSANTMMLSSITLCLPLSLSLMRALRLSQECHLVGPPPAVPVAQKWQTMKGKSHLHIPCLGLGLDCSFHSDGHWQKGQCFLLPLAYPPPPSPRGGVREHPTVTLPLQLHCNRRKFFLQRLWRHGLFGELMPPPFPRV